MVKSLPVLVLCIGAGARSRNRSRSKTDQLRNTARYLSFIKATLKKNYKPFKSLTLPEFGPDIIEVEEISLHLRSTYSLLQGKYIMQDINQSTHHRWLLVVALGFMFFLLLLFVFLLLLFLLLLLLLFPRLEVVPAVLLGIGRDDDALGGGSGEGRRQGRTILLIT